MFGILAYFVLCMLHFIIFAIMKPKISSMRRLRVLRVCYFVVWLILVIMVVILELSCFFFGWTITEYNVKWITELSEL